MEKLYIICNSQEEEKEVLKKLEKQGKDWNCSGAKATKRSFYQEAYVEFAIVDNGKTVTWTPNTTRSMKSEKQAKKISAAEFLKENKETIVIYRNGDETIALEKNTGRKAVAKCHADDTYSFETGAKLALERLFPSPVREVSRYAEVGEYIKITNPIGAMGKYGRGDIFRVKEACKETDNVVHHVRCYEHDYLIRYDEYVVLENYKPEEAKQYYNGKVVCIQVGKETPINILTKGKIYEFVDGIITFDNGDKTEIKRRSLEEINENFSSKFIELVE